MFYYCHIKFFFRSLLRPCIKNLKLAPTQKQRLGYKKWLHVYAKEKSAITPRMASLIDIYNVSERVSSLFQYKLNLLLQQSIETLADGPSWYRYPSGANPPPVYDAFEPNYVKSALTLKPMHLGELIFGRDEWMRYGEKPGISNALTELFGSKGKWSLIYLTFFSHPVFSCSC
jgi:hypothetical protein